MFYMHMKYEEIKRFDAALQSLVDIYGDRNIFIADNLIAFDRNLTFAKDPRFREIVAGRAQSPLEKSVIWRLHVLCWAGLHARKIEGDFVECGVYEALSSTVVASFLEFETLPKKLWLYDLFDHGTETSGLKLPGHGSGLFERVSARFARYPNVNVIQGLIPDSFAKGLPDRVSWFHLDLNSATAETAALEVLFDRMSPGALLILDDYGWTAYAGQKEAADAFAKARDHSILELPTGQGLLIKR